MSTRVNNLFGLVKAIGIPGIPPPVPRSYMFLSLFLIFCSIFPKYNEWTMNSSHMYCKGFLLIKPLFMPVVLNQLW